MTGPGGIPGHSRADVSPQILEKKALKTGHLYKLGFKFKTWKYRYCIMTHDCLYYFVSAEANNQKGEVILDEVTSVASDDQTFPRKPYIFAVESPRRTFYFQASSTTDRDEWISILNMHITH
eukprot:Phypoly_transcript_22514.p1 GENE.Phypoly_transcript_22514~~Phypoly_transcript_22514.p1  ORF type:complete len:122 (+),score=11.49 Phypoly_transcript_22514:161-526(+)